MKKKNTRRLPLVICTAVLLVAILTATFASVITDATGGDLGSSPFIGLFDGKLNIDSSQFYDGTVIQKLPSSISDDDEISLIIGTGNISVLDAYDETSKAQSLSEFYVTDEAQKIIKDSKEQAKALSDKLAGNNISFALGETYSTLFTGFEIVVKAGDFLDVCKTLGDGVDVIVGDVYEAEEITEPFSNNVNAFPTGIFDTTGFDYDGTGMVVAVLDTGTDYYHSAFSSAPEWFTAAEKDWGLTFSDIEAVIKDTTASGFHEAGLTASDVYISGKLPYGYDYADKDSDVYPINNHHGTHVAGIIAGKDKELTGVAPNAQIVTMKIFSDTESSSRTSWILAALEDCVVLGVDVINMSIGTACGFSRETDKEQINGIYDRIRERGINMVVAASNSFNSAYSSDRNGNLPLTTNPDSGTVGSPSTYEGAISVASIEGAKTSYLLFGDRIIYFEESTNRVSEERHFVEELLGSGTKNVEMEYVLIPGSGVDADYAGMSPEYTAGKIALIRRGTTTFEEKANVAQEKGFAGAIIFNNVSGDIKMNVGETEIPVCSISQTDGEKLAETPTGKIRISTDQVAGPFMSDFSSWGPTPELGIKPEITAHGGSILSAVPGQEYDRISGTSMATPNISGVTALLRQYVINNFFASKKDNLTDADNVEIAAMINRLMMSTADIIVNKNGNPYSVRKQGAGLANLNNCADTTAYILTYNDDGSEMDKSKIELGDDPEKKGVYTLVFTIDNFGSTSLSYDISAYVMTEGVSDIKTSHGDTTVTETSYMLDADVAISSVSGGTQNGMNVTVAAGSKATVTLTVTLTDSDKKYLDESFKNGMYVEGFVNLEASGDAVNLHVPYLAFYGDWTVAPLFDRDFYETNKDELDDSIDMLDKTLADAFATRPIGGISDDYVSYLGSFYYEQKPGSNMISAKREYISLTNHTNGVNSLRYIWAGMLRNADYVTVVITDDATGEIVYETTDHDIRKSYGDGGPIRPANIDVEFSAIDHNLKNNSKYTVTMTGYLDYGDGGIDTNLNNTFVFPLTIDFEAPTLTDCEFYTEYDRSAKKNRLFAKMAVYDNHYAMAMLPGYVMLDNSGSEPEFKLENFERYLTPIYSEENSTTYVTYELTDYIDEIKELSYHKNTFAITVYDYALNIATYEIALPDDYVDLYFDETEIVLSPNQTYDLKPIVYPGTEWGELVTYESAKESVADVINNKLIATGSGNTVIKCVAPLKNGETKTKYLSIKVLKEGDEGYRKIDPPVLESFSLYGYYVNKAYYFLSSDEREIGETGDTMKFVGDSYYLSMYPSESVTIQYDLDAYFPNTDVEFETSSSTYATVTKDGTITALKEGYASVTARVLKDGESTFYSQTINIEIKEPWVTSGPSLSHYYGNGGLVTIPSDLGVTDIGQFAFSNYDYIPKTEEEKLADGDESPESTKIWFIGDDTIEEVIIPEGVESIGPFAFANLTKLRKVTLPSTLKTIDYGAFYGCTSLTSIVTKGASDTNGFKYVKFINQNAFNGTALSGAISFDSAIAIADYAFAGNPLITSVTLSENCKSVGAYAFAYNTKLKTLNVKSEFLKLSQHAFDSCKELTSVSINAAVIPTGTFNGCTNLETVKLGADVAVIGEHAFRNTKVSSFEIAEGNTAFKTGISSCILNKDGTEIMLVAPALASFDATNLPAGQDATKVTSIAAGAFSGNKNITTVNLPYVTAVKDYAFSECTRLTDVTLGKLTKIGSYAFTNTMINEIPAFSTDVIGNYAFASTYIREVNIPDGTFIGEGAFEECVALKSVTIGDNVEIGKYAFRYNTARDHYTTEKYDDVSGRTLYYFVYTSPLTSLTIGEKAVIGEGAFWFASKLQSITLGAGAEIGDYAFYTTPELVSIDLSAVKSIGKHAFSGDILYEYTNQDCTTNATDADGNYIYRYYASKLSSVDLGACESIGEDAFAYCLELTSVNLGDGITVIPTGVFRSCEKLGSIDLSGVTEIGDYAFADTVLASADLSSLVSIGEYTFLEAEKLESVVFSDSIDHIGEAAFAYCKALRSVTGLESAEHIGDYSFAYTALTSADLTSATYIGTHAFMKEAAAVRPDFALKLGTSIKTMGDNPFAWCKLAPFSMTVTESFNGVDYESTVYTFELGENVRVIDGSLYRVVPRGLELVYYCDMGATANVADGTVRISAYAFSGSDAVNVVLPYTVESIGHKAFFGCEKLALVNFSSYYAPTLEEEYDVYYFYEGTNLPTPPEYDSDLGASGLGIVNYFMWNVTSDPTNIFYGASFKDYVGKVENKAIMVKPVNGVHYDSFIFGQYFDVVLEGASAADDVTLAAIEAISNIPDNLTLADKHLVETARVLYNKIALNEQKALVKDYQKLLDAERRISDLEYLENQQPDTPDDDVEEAAPIDGMLVLGIVFAVTALGCGAGIGIYFFVKRKEDVAAPDDGGKYSGNNSDDNSEDSEQ